MITDWRRYSAFMMLTLTTAAAVSADPGPAPARQQELMHLLRQDCGSCHGLHMTGGLGPPLTRIALADKPAVMLRAVILHGRPGTPMPPWKGFMNEAEAGWLVQQLQAGVADGRQ